MTGPAPAGPESARVAICTLADEALRQRLLASKPAVHALVGPLTSDLHGVEMLAESLLQRPLIRFLIVPGESEALERLFRGEGSWPNLSQERQAALRRQVELVRTTPDHVSAAVQACLDRWPGPAEETTAASPPALPLERVPPAERCFDVADPAGYVIVGLADGLITADHYDTAGRLTRRLAGPDSEAVAQALARLGLIGRMDHALYIGRELMKAEVARRLGLPYVQDEPLQLQ